MRATTLTTTLTSSNAASFLLSSSLRKMSSFNNKANHHRGKKSAFGVIVTPQRRGRFGRTNSLKNSSAGECELVECEVDFATKDDDEKEDAFGASLTTIKACVANINGNTIDASALRNVTLMNSKGNLEKLPLTGDKDVVVYLRHLG